MSHEFQNLGIEAIADILGTELPGRAGQQGEDEEKNIWEVRMETKFVDTPCIFLSRYMAIFECKAFVFCYPFGRF